MQEEKLDEVLELIINKKMSIRKASQEYGYGRDFLKSRLIKKYGQTPDGLEKIQELMTSNKANSTTREIEPGKLESVFLRTINREITLEEACKELGGIDSETLRHKFIEYTKELSDPEVLQKYKEYRKLSPEENDLQYVNFRVLAIEMIRNGRSQSYIAAMLGISPRTISREFEKLSLDEDTSLYNLIKFYSDKVMRRKTFTKKENFLIEKTLYEYEQKHPDLLAERVNSKSENFAERMRFLNVEETRLRGEGLTQEEIAQKLGTSISGLRRAKIFCEEMANISSTENNSSQENVETTEQPVREDR